MGSACTIHCARARARASPQTNAGGRPRVERDTDGVRGHVSFVTFRRPTRIRSQLNRFRRLVEQLTPISAHSRNSLSQRPVETQSRVNEGFHRETRDPRAHARQVTDRIHFPLLGNLLQMTSRLGQRAQLTPCSEDLDALSANLRTFLSGLLGSEAVSLFAPAFPRDPRLELHFSRRRKKKTHARTITSDSSPSPSPPSAALLRLSFSSQVTCTPAFLCPRSRRHRYAFTCA